MYLYVCESICEFTFNHPQDVIRTTVLKVHIHCAQCDKDLQHKLLKHKGKIESLEIFKIIKWGIRNKFQNLILTH